MTPPKKDEKAKVPTIESMRCNWCDGNTAAVPGHEVTDGAVTKCPFIDVNLGSSAIRRATTA